MKLGLILISSSLLFLGACAPGFVPDRVSIETKWAETRGSQPGNQNHIIGYSKSTRVNNIVEKLAEAAGIRGLKVYVNEDPSWNASMNSFHKLLVVNSGLLNQTPSEDELAAVIGHELGHYVFHHSEQLVQATNTNQQLKEIFYNNSSTAKKAENRAEVAILLNEILVNKPAQRNSEREADSFGIMLMKKAGYDPSAAIRVWWKKYQEAKQLGASSQLLATHPMGDERILNLMRTVAVFNKEN